MPLIRHRCLLFPSLCVAVFLTAAGGCDRGAPTGSVGKPVIAVSIFPLANLTEQLTGDWADVVLLLPASESPHEAELTPDKTGQLARADFAVVVGMGLDPWAEKAIEAADNKRLRVVRFSDLIAGDASPKVTTPSN